MDQFLGALNYVKGSKVNILYFSAIPCFPCHNILLVIMDVWIPTERAAEGMKDTDKPRDKVFGFVQGEKTFFDDIRNSLEKAVKQSAVFEEKAAEGFVNGEDEMAMGTLY